MASEEEKEKMRKTKLKWRAKNIKNKKYYCEKCERAYSENKSLNIHLKSNKHNDIHVNYECNLIDIYKRECKFNTRDKLLYTRHLKTKKHNYGKKVQNFSIFSLNLMSTALK